jgi:hypothetical protein
VADLTGLAGAVLVSAVLLFVAWPLELGVVLGLGRIPASPRLESAARRYQLPAPMGSVPFVLCLAALAILQIWPISQLLLAPAPNRLAGALCIAVEAAAAIYMWRDTRSAAR